jgi:regulator of replication initiation timing
MDALTVLEDKVRGLVSHVGTLKTENNRLTEENLQLREQLDALETLILKDKSETSQDRELTKMVVDGLIESIDALTDHKLN